MKELSWVLITAMILGFIYWLIEIKGVSVNKLAIDKVNVELGASSIQKEQERKIAAEIAEKNAKIKTRAYQVAEELGKSVVNNAYQGGQNIGTTLDNYTYSESDLTYQLTVKTRWNGKLTGESGYEVNGIIVAKMDGSGYWKYGQNYRWNPTWQSAKLEEWIGQKSVMDIFMKMQQNQNR